MEKTKFIKAENGNGRKILTELYRRGMKFSRDLESAIKMYGEDEYLYFLSPVDGDLTQSSDYNFYKDNPEYEEIYMKDLFGTSKKPFIIGGALVASAIAYWKLRS